MIVAQRWDTQTHVESNCVTASYVHVVTISLILTFTTVCSYGRTHDKLMIGLCQISQNLAHQSVTDLTAKYGAFQNK